MSYGLEIHEHQKNALQAAWDLGFRHFLHMSLYDLVDHSRCHDVTYFIVSVTSSADVLPVMPCLGRFNFWDSVLTCSSA